MNITDKNQINELLTKAFQKECQLVDDAKPSYKLQFSCALNISEFEEFRESCERFLSQYDIETGASLMRYPKEGSRVFVLPLKKLCLDKLAALLTDIQLHEAVSPDGVFQVQELLAKGANINNKNIMGDTALHIATQRDYVPIVSFLLEEKALVNIPNDKGETALQIADQKRDSLIGKAMIDALLNTEPKAEKPELVTQDLSDYWDAQSQKSTTQDLAEGEIAVSNPQKATQTIGLFFARTSPGADAQQYGAVAVAYKLAN